MLPNQFTAPPAWIVQELCIGNNLLKEEAARRTCHAYAVAYSVSERLGGGVTFVPIWFIRNVLLPLFRAENKFIWPCEDENHNQ